MRTVYVGAAGLRGCPWCGVPKGMTLHPLIIDQIICGDVNELLFCTRTAHPGDPLHVACHAWRHRANMW